MFFLSIFFRQLNRALKDFFKTFVFFVRVFSNIDKEIAYSSGLFKKYCMGSLNLILGISEFIIIYSWKVSQEAIVEFNLSLHKRVQHFSKNTTTKTFLEKIHKNSSRCL